MELGIAVFATDVSWPIDDLARAVEERGFASLAVPEHTHMPVGHSDHPAGQGLPDEYRRTLDPVVALTTAAAATSSLRLLFGVSLLAQHDPIALAKAVASLDHVSAGRVEFGVGYGWNRPELEHHGVAWAERRAVVADRVETLRALWRDEVATVDRPHAQLAPSWAWPKPIQRPGPPILLGAALGPRTLDDLARHFDGWLPLGRTAARRRSRPAPARLGGGGPRGPTDRARARRGTEGRRRPGAGRHRRGGPGQLLAAVRAAGGDAPRARRVHRAPGGRGVSDTSTGPAAPRYGEGSVADLLPDLLGSLIAADDRRLIPVPDGTRAVIVLVIDGLGRRNLDDHLGLAPTLSAASGPTLDAPFPTTTATSLTCIGTGLAPGEHGITGYSFAIPGDDRPLIALTWTWERQLGGDDARGDVPPESIQTRPTVFDQARAAGVRPVTVLRPEFATSGLTRAGLRGGEVVAATELEPSLDAAIGASTGSERALVYVHHGDLDTIGHLTGPGSDPWCEELARIDGVLTTVRERLPADVALVVTADHGMVHVAPEGFIELADHPDLLAGVRVLTGDGRARQLHTLPGARDEVLAAWRDHVGDRGHVLTRDEAITAGWFGPIRDEAVRATIGDVLAVADAHIAWVHRDADLFGGRFAGLHAGLTRREVEVPALVLTSR